jgi:hypothetical protein
MLFLLVILVLLCVVVVYSGAVSRTGPGTMSEQWLAERRASRAV